MTGTVTITVPALIASTTTTQQLTATVGTVFSQQLTVSGGISPWTWTTTPVSGSLPPGWTISTSGVLSAPTAPTNGQAGTYNFTVAVNDSGTYSANLPLTVTINPAPAIAFGAAPTAAGTYNVAYSSGVSATGGAGALSYSSASLPSWLTLDPSTGAIIGTPTTAAEVTTYNFTVTASDSFGDSMISPQYTIAVSYPAVVIAPATGALPVAYAGSAYSSGNLTASGGSGTGFIWSVASGSSLPAWLHFSSTTGSATTLTGTPATAASAASFTLKVTDSAGNSQTVNYSVTVDSGISISPVTGALPVAYANLAYSSGTLTASGGSGTGYTWSTVSGSLPPSWLSFSTTTGAATTLTGTPAAAASAASFTLKVTDSAGNSQTITYSVTVDAGITLNPSGGALPTAYVNSAYSTTLVANGGSGSGQNWTVASGSTLPSWLSLNATTGVLSGTPAAAASAADFSTEVTDSAGNMATGSYSVTVVAGVSPPTFSPASGKYTSIQTVSISDATTGAAIYYTTDGSTPTTASSAYNGAITVSANETLQAIASVAGYSTSAVSSAVYSITLPASTPTFSPVAGTYTSAQTVTISDTTTGSTIYYTTDGTAPTSSSTAYTVPITVSASETVQAIATAAGYSTSSAGSAVYTINPPSTADLWTWIGGSSSTVASCTAGSPHCGVAGVYSNLGSFVSGNMPGSRDSASSWTDNNGNLWLFGGEGIDANGNADGFVNLNDLWEFNPSTQQWAWIGGSSTVSNGGEPGLYGPIGTPGTGYIPGSRSWPATVQATDSNGNVWLFGGYGYDASGTQDELSDLWEFNTSSKEWTFVSGSSTAAQPGAYVTQGSFAAGNMPGGRDSGPSWVDNSGNLWIFGGEGYPNVVSWSVLNDLWEFNPSTKLWAWMGGSKTGNQSGSYVAQGTFDPGNYPGGRTNPSYWTDSSGNFWMFGGWGIDSKGNLNLLNDVWEFNPSTNLWAWIGGGTVVNQPGVYSQQPGTPSTGYIPGSRQSAPSWTDNLGNFWLAGGYGYDSSGNAGDLNDLWEFNPTTNQWTWMSGSSTVGSNGGQSGVYGSPGQTTAGNTPGGRTNAAGWTDSAGNFWLFAGQGYDSAGTLGGLNDLWEFQPGIVAKPVFSPAAGAYATAPTVTISDATPGAKIYYTINGTAPTTSSSVYNGPIAVAATEVIEAFATASGNTPSGVSSASYTIGPQAVPPSFSPAAGTYTSAQTVTISDTTSGAVIYYTTDGSTPTTASSAYNGAITVSANETLQAIATGSGLSPSLVSSAVYIISLPTATPVFSPLQGTYAVAQTVTISDSNANSTIYFTTDGTTPTTNSAVYNGPIAVSTSETVQAIAAAPGLSPSAIASAGYTIGGVANAPTFSLPAGTYNTPQTLTISDTTPGASIYYAANGVPVPGNYGTNLYAGPVNLLTFFNGYVPATLEAIAVAPGYSQSRQPRLITIL